MWNSLTSSGHTPSSGPFRTFYGKGVPFYCSFVSGCRSVASSIRKTKCDYGALAATLCLEQTQCIHFSAKTKEGSEQSNIAGKYGYLISHAGVFILWYLSNQLFQVLSLPTFPTLAAIVNFRQRICLQWASISIPRDSRRQSLTTKFLMPKKLPSCFGTTLVSTTHHFTCFMLSTSFSNTVLNSGGTTCQTSCHGKLGYQSWWLSWRSKTIPLTQWCCYYNV